MKKAFKISILSLVAVIFSLSLFAFSAFAAPDTDPHQSIKLTNGSSGSVNYTVDNNGKVTGYTYSQTGGRGPLTVQHDADGMTLADAKVKLQAKYAPPPAAAATAPPAKAVLPCIASTSYWGVPTSFNPNACILQFIVNPLLSIASWLLWIAAVIFNFSLDYSLNFKEKVLDNLPIVDIGWKVLRDVANICFIFVLLAIAIGTILQVDSYNVKKTLVRVILVALLLNFSLFFTEVVIDASNILALQFYERINVIAGPGSANDLDGGISQAFMKGLRITSIYATPSSGVVSGVVDVYGAYANSLSIVLGGAFLILIITFVFLAATILFIIRSVTLIFLMILSPLAFVALAIPSMKGQYDKWQKTLISQAFFAPLYMVMVYIVISILSSNFVTGSGTTVTFADFLAGQASAVTILYNFIIMIALMIGSLIVAKNLGAYGSDIARNVAGQATFGLTGLAARHSIGRWANGIAKSDTMDRWRNGNLAARSVAGAFDRTAKGSFDIRAGAIGKGLAGAAGGFGNASGAGGFKQISDDDKKRKAEYQKTINQQKKNYALDTALGMKETNDVEKEAKTAAVQKALNDFSDSEYKELGKSELTNPWVIKNSRYSQIQAVTDEKNEKATQEIRDKIYSGRISELNDAIKGKAGTRPIDKILDGMSDAEKSNLPQDIISNKEVFRHFNKSVQDKIADRKDLTPTQLKQVNKSRGDALVDSAFVSKDPKLVKSIVKGMSAKGLLTINNKEFSDDAKTIPNPGYKFLAKPEIAKYLTPTQLNDLISLDDLDAGDAYKIAEYVKDPTNAAAGLSYMRKKDNLEQYGHTPPPPKP